MPRSNRKPKPGKRGYRKNLTAPPKRCRPYKGGLRSKAKDTCMGEGESVSKTSSQSSLAVSSDDNTFTGFASLPCVQGIRMLSLFDGIGTARFVLNQLEVPIEAYFSSEINEDANKVLKRHYFEDINMLGCVRSMKGDKVASLGKIHLLVGASPCSDLSLCNPKRRGLHRKDSTGSLFFEYHRILLHLRDAARKNNHAFYWFYENTRAMEKANLKQISEYLGCEPVVICSSVRDSAMARKRCYWGNLPGLAAAAFGPSNESRPHLQDYLMPYRRARVPSLPTLTGSSHSQLTGKNKELPVSEDGRPDKLFIIEEERVFGLPDGYTDIHLSLTARQKLLGKAWCVQTIRRLFEPFSKIVKAGTLDI